MEQIPACEEVGQIGYLAGKQSVTIRHVQVLTYNFFGRSYLERFYVLAIFGTIPGKKQSLSFNVIEFIQIVIKTNNQKSSMMPAIKCLVQSR